MLQLHGTGTTVIAELTDKDYIISGTQDLLDLFGELVSENCNSIIVSEKNLHPDFFRLPTGLAGDILQKVSNYRFRLAVIGDFSKYKSKNLHDFIRESNRGNRIFFEDLASALEN